MMHSLASKSAELLNFRNHLFPVILSAATHLRRAASGPQLARPRCLALAPSLACSLPRSLAPSRQAASSPAGTRQ